jgi:hypothetical protein
MAERFFDAGTGCFGCRADGRCACLDGAGLEEQLLRHSRPRASHAGDGRRHPFCLVPEPFEPVRLAVPVGKRFRAPGDIIPPLPRSIWGVRSFVSAQEVTSTPKQRPKENLNYLPAEDVLNRFATNYHRDNHISRGTLTAGVRHRRRLSLDGSDGATTRLGSDLRNGARTCSRPVSVFGR